MQFRNWIKLYFYSVLFTFVTWTLEWGIDVALNYAQYDWDWWSWYYMSIFSFFTVIPAYWLVFIVCISIARHATTLTTSIFKSIIFSLSLGIVLPLTALFIYTSGTYNSFYQWKSDTVIGYFINAAEDYQMFELSAILFFPLMAFGILFYRVTGKKLSRNGKDAHS